MDRLLVMSTAETLEAQVKEKLLELFKPWCELYIAGKVTDTPRYCQLDLYPFNTVGQNTRLYSTIGGYSIPFEVEKVFNEEQIKWMKAKFSYSEDLDMSLEPTYIWDWWKEVRKDFLFTNYGTVNP